MSPFFTASEARAHAARRDWVHRKGGGALSLTSIMRRIAREANGDAVYLLRADDSITEFWMLEDGRFRQGTYQTGGAATAALWARARAVRDAAGE